MHKTLALIALFTFLGPLPLSASQSARALAQSTHVYGLVGACPAAHPGAMCVALYAPPVLYTLNLASGGADAVVGNVEFANGTYPALTTIAQAPTGTLYATDGETLYTIETANGCPGGSCHSTRIGDLGIHTGTFLATLAFDHSGNLYGGTSDGWLVRIDPNSGTITQYIVRISPPDTTSYFAFSGGMAFGPDGALYATANSVCPSCETFAAVAQSDVLVTFSGPNWNPVVGSATILTGALTIGLFSTASSLYGVTGQAFLPNGGSPPCGATSALVALDSSSGSGALIGCLSTAYTGVAGAPAMPAATITPTSTPSLTPSATNTPTETPVPTDTPTDIPTPTDTDTSAPIDIPTPTDTPTDTPTTNPTCNSETLTINPTSGAPGSTVGVTWFDECDGGTVNGSVSFDGQNIGSFTAQDDAGWIGTVTIPTTAQPGSHTISIGDDDGSSGSATFTVPGGATTTPTATGTSISSGGPAPPAATEPSNMPTANGGNAPPTGPSSACAQQSVLAANADLTDAIRLLQNQTDKALDALLQTETEQDRAIAYFRADIPRKVAVGIGGLLIDNIKAPEAAGSWQDSLNEFLSDHTLPNLKALLAAARVAAPVAMTKGLAKVDIDKAIGGTMYWLLSGDKRYGALIAGEVAANRAQVKTNAAATLARLRRDPICSVSAAKSLLAEVRSIISANARLPQELQSVSSLIRGIYAIRRQDERDDTLQHQVGSFVSEEGLALLASGISATVCGGCGGPLVHGYEKFLDTVKATGQVAEDSLLATTGAAMSASALPLVVAESANVSAALHVVQHTSPASVPPGRITHLTMVERDKWWGKVTEARVDITLHHATDARARYQALVFYQYKGHNLSLWLSGGVFDWVERSQEQAGQRRGDAQLVAHLVTSGNGFEPFKDAMVQVIILAHQGQMTFYVDEQNRLWRP